MRHELLIQAVLNRIQAELDRQYWNKYQDEMASPFLNTGNTYENDTFVVRAYYWGDSRELMKLPNFQYKNFECRWYKHSQRGVVWWYEGIQWAEVPSGFLAQMLEDCFESMERDFKKKSN